MKRTKELTDLRELDSEAVGEQVSSMEHELMNLRFKHASGQLEHTAQLKTLRRSIARGNTVMRERQMKDLQS